MKVRLYDAGKKFKDYVDRYTLYFPVCKKLQAREGRGFYLGCSPDGNDGVIRCCWETNENDQVNSKSLWFGKRIAIESMPKGFQRFAMKMEKLWNDALKYDDEEHWEAWNQA